MLVSELWMVNSEFRGEIRFGWGGGDPSSLCSTPFDSLLCPGSLVLSSPVACDTVGPFPVGIDGLSPAGASFIVSNIH